MERGEIMRELMESEKDFMGLFLWKWQFNCIHTQPCTVCLPPFLKQLQLFLRKMAFPHCLNSKPWAPWWIIHSPEIQNDQKMSNSLIFQLTLFECAPLTIYIFKPKFSIDPVCMWTVDHLRFETFCQMSNWLKQSDSNCCPVNEFLRPRSVDGGAHFRYMLS